MTIEKYSVQTLRDYLLGHLPEPEAERLDELSITDEECAERIRAAEHDLVDAFARGELNQAASEQFRTRYLTTPRGRAATRFAEALQSRDENFGRGGLSGRGPMLDRERWHGRGRMALAAAAILLTLASTWLLLDNRMLRARATSAEAASHQLQRERQLQEAEANRPTEIAPPSGGRGASPLPLATLVLAPPLRNARQLPTVALTDGSRELPVQLELEPVDYPSYDASLIASSGDQLLWRADRLIARTVGGRQTIELRLPAAVLGPQDYLIRVSGTLSSGASEIVGEYRFAVVR